MFTCTCSSNKIFIYRARAISPVESNKEQIKIPEVCFPEAPENSQNQSQLDVLPQINEENNKINTPNITNLNSSIDKKSPAGENYELKCSKSREGHLTKLSQNLDNFAKKINSSDSNKSKDSDTKLSGNKNHAVENKSVRESQDSNREGNN